METLEVVDHLGKVALVRAGREVRKALEILSRSMEEKGLLELVANYSRYQHIDIVMGCKVYPTVDCI